MRFLFWMGIFKCFAGHHTGKWIGPLRTRVSTAASDDLSVFRTELRVIEFRRCQRCGVREERVLETVESVLTGDPESYR